MAIKKVPIIVFVLVLVLAGFGCSKQDPFSLNLPETDIQKYRQKSKIDKTVDTIIGDIEELHSIEQEELEDVDEFETNEEEIRSFGETEL